jgi:hypothetical protein
MYTVMNTSNPTKISIEACQWSPKLPKMISIDARERITSPKVASLVHSLPLFPTGQFLPQFPAYHTTLTVPAGTTASPVVPATTDHPHGVLRLLRPFPTQHHGCPSLHLFQQSDFTASSSSSTPIYPSRLASRGSTRLSLHPTSAL